jgi:uncharacterized protein GlcG (DUF336 family)
VAELTDRKLALAKALCEATLAEAQRLGFDICVIAVDTGGHPIALLRSDLCPYAPMEAARRKAITAASMKAPSAMMAEMLAHDPLAAAALAASPDLLAVPGGFPIILDQVCVGGFGVAGGHYRDDAWLGEAALAAVLGPNGEHRA